MSSEMRECPFCGNQPRSGWQGTGVPGMDDCGYWGIDCCNAFAHADTEAEALAQWNRRSDAPNGSWLWCKLMDFCQKRRFPPAEFNDLFAIVTEAHELNNRALLARTEAGPSLLCQSDACAHKGTAHNFCTPRTEAGADGAEPFGWWIECHGTDGDFGQFVTDRAFVDLLRSHGVVERETALYTHPQDASGDAERFAAVMNCQWLRSSKYGDQVLGWREEFLSRVNAEVVAMQAKEAK